MQKVVHRILHDTAVATKTESGEGEEGQAAARNKENQTDGAAWDQMTASKIILTGQAVSFFLLCFTSFFVFRIADLPHSPGVVYYHLLLRRETRIPGVAPFSFRIGIWDLFVHRGQKSFIPTAFGKLWTTPGVRCMKHASS